MMIKKNFLTYLVITFSLPVLLCAQNTVPFKSIRDFGVSPDKSGAENKKLLQEAIDWASTRGAALYIEPSEEPYPMEGGIILKQNSSLIGVHGPVGRGTGNNNKKEPVGSVFKIEDEKNPFITVEGATQLKGIQFWYPNQAIKDSSKIIKYPPTIMVSHEKNVYGVTLSCLTFYGEYIAMDFNADRQFPCEQILIEHCYGYPLSGQFIRIDYCYDIPRILHCHINPGNLRYILKGDSFAKEICDAVVAQKTFAYAINRTDNAVIMDIFTFGTYGGVYLGESTYGQLTGFNFDCVVVGIYKLGDNHKNRNWQIAQGSIISNTGKSPSDAHPIIIEGKGHTSLTNVETFSGLNPALTTFPESEDFMLVRGKDKLTVSLYGCRMSCYRSEKPITIDNPGAVIQASDCIDKDENPFSLHK